MAAQLHLATERRSEPRYPVTASVEYRLLLPNSVFEAGIGTLINMSSNGVLMETAEFLPHGVAVELFIAWPSKLNNREALDLYVTGTTVRTRGIHTAVEIYNSEFRIRETRASINKAIPVLCHL